MQGRYRDELQGIFRVCFDLLTELGKGAHWKSYDHEVHGFVYVQRNADGEYAPDPIQRQAVRDSIAFFDVHIGAMGR